MPDRLRWTMTTAGVLVAVAVPTLASLYIAHRQSMGEERTKAAIVAAEVLRRAEGMAVQGLSGYLRLQAQKAEPCSEAQLELMRRIDASADLSQVTGYVAGGKLKCSSLGQTPSDIDLGPVRNVGRNGVRMRTSVDLGLEHRKRFLVFELGSYATAILPESLVEFGAHDKDLSVGVVSGDLSTLLSARGTFDPSWSKRLGSDAEVSFFDGKHLVALQRSKRFDLTAFAAVPTRKLKAQLAKVVLILLPMGLALGAAMAAGLVWLVRHQSSFPAVLRTALRRREFSLHYQPIVHLASGGVVGVEALLRWNRKNGESMKPDIFIPAAEDCGLIEQITAFVLEQLAVELPIIMRECPDCYISINLSAADLQSPATVTRMKDLLQKSGIRPDLVVVEATEHSLVLEESATPVITALRAIGVRLAIDDFGTGYSNLAYLHRLQSDFLKIDRAFVESIGSESATSHVAFHIITLAQSLNLIVIAEGVETEQQAGLLLSHGAEYAQGWLYGRPVPVHDLTHSISGKPAARAVSSA